MLRGLLLLTLLSLSGWAAERWYHYNLNVSLVVPAEWRLSKGPVMVELSPPRDWKGDRRPRFHLVWRYPAPSFKEFENQVHQSGAAVDFFKKGQVAGHEARRARISTGRERVEVILVRVSDAAAYLIQHEALEVDWAAAAPVFQQIEASLQLGPKLSPEEKEKRSKWQ